MAQAPAGSSDAEALIMQGLKLREQGQDAGALTLFERAYELAPTPRAMAQRALAEHALGSWVQAEEHLRAALAVKDDPWIALHNDALTRSLATIGDHLGTLQVNGGRQGAELRIDGQLVGQLPLPAPLRVVIGQSLLEVALNGYYPVRREITVKAGGVSTETIELVPVPVQVAQPAQVEAAQPVARAELSTKSGPPPRLSPWVFWTGAAVTVGLGAVTLWSGLNTVAKNDAYEAYVADGGLEVDMAKSGFETADSAQTRTNILIAGTAVAGVATAVIGVFFTDWGGASEEHAARQRTPRARLYAGPTGYGLTFDQRF